MSYHRTVRSPLKWVLLCDVYRLCRCLNYVKSDIWRSRNLSTIHPSTSPNVFLRSMRNTADILCAISGDLVSTRGRIIRLITAGPDLMHLHGDFDYILQPPEAVTTYQGPLVEHTILAFLHGVRSRAAHSCC